jgi:hypothetical protein
MQIPAKETDLLWVIPLHEIRDGGNQLVQIHSLTRGSCS